ncbi:MAG: hypothetical protein WBA01_18575 [Phormidesmis sp.]
MKSSVNTVLMLGLIVVLGVVLGTGGPLLVANALPELGAVNQDARIAEAAEGKVNEGPEDGWVLP